MGKAISSGVAAPSLKSRISILLAEKMPGWKIDPASVSLAPSVEDSNMRSERGPSFDQLARKFGADDSSDAVGADRFTDTKPNRITERVVPKNGGPSKVIDINPDTGSIDDVSG